MSIRAGFPRGELVEILKAYFPPECRVELVFIDDPYTELTPGEQGTVKFVDAIGTVFVEWDCGCYLGVVHGIDRIVKL